MAARKKEDQPTSFIRSRQTLSKVELKAVFTFQGCSLPLHASEVHPLARIFWCHEAAKPHFDCTGKLSEMSRIWVQEGNLCQNAWLPAN